MSLNPDPPAPVPRAPDLAAPVRRVPVLRAPPLRTPMSVRRGLQMDRRRAWWVGGSVALHLAALALLLVTRRPEPDQPMAPNYELVFDNGGKSTPSTSEQTSKTDAAPQAMAENPAPAQEPAPAAAAPNPVPDLLPPEPAPPAPPAAEVEPPPPAPSQQQAMALPDPVTPPQPPDTPAQPVPVQPGPAELPQPQASKAPPAVRLTQPDEPPSITAMTQAPTFTPPVPPPPLPPPPAPPRPRPPAPPRQALGSLSSPMDLNFGQASSRAPVPPRGSVASRAIDFSLGAPKAGPNRSEAFFDIRAANIGADWAQGLAAYWLRHRYYPTQALESGEDGTVKIQIVVNRLGRVVSAEVLDRSGSPWLDMAAVGTWRNAQLAPLPAENNDPTITIPLTINYLLIRH